MLDLGAVLSLYARAVNSQFMTCRKERETRDQCITASQVVQQWPAILRRNRKAWNPAHPRASTQSIQEASFATSSASSASSKSACVFACISAPMNLTRVLLLSRAASLSLRLSRLSFPLSLSTGACHPHVPQALHHLSSFPSRQNNRWRPEEPCASRRKIFAVNHPSTGRILCAFTNFKIPQTSASAQSGAVDADI
eukprot:scaffold954_cov221-Pinguiococcus_pyrenoidosus.AAC.4